MIVAPIIGSVTMVRASRFSLLMSKYSSSAATVSFQTVSKSFTGTTNGFSLIVVGTITFETLAQPMTVKPATGIIAKSAIVLKRMSMASISYRKPDPIKLVRVTDFPGTPQTCRSCGQETRTWDLERIRGAVDGFGGGRIMMVFDNSRKPFFKRESPNST